MQKNSSDVNADGRRPPELPEDGDRAIERPILPNPQDHPQDHLQDPQSAPPPSPPGLRRGSLFYKTLAALILLSLLPMVLTSARLLTLNNNLLEAGGSEWNLPPSATAQISTALTSEAFTYLLYTFIIIAIIALFVSGSLIHPLRELQSKVARYYHNFHLDAGDTEHAADGIRPAEFAQEFGALSGNEIEQLNGSFNRLAQELTSMQHSLAEEIEVRTRHLEHRAALMQAAASVAQVAASIRNLDELLSRACALVSQHFGYYHSGIFLLDMNREFAILRAANSEGGQQMLEREHKLPVSETSIVGYVASTRQPRVALNVGVDAVHFKNPYLPETRSEMALPLAVGERLWGVLDVQSTEENAFSEEDIETLQILANQLAIAIENANLFIENQAALEELRAALEMSRKVYGEISQEAWRKLLQSRPEIGYLARQSSSRDHPTLSPIHHSDDAVKSDEESLAWYPAMQKSLQSGENQQPDSDTLIIPIKIRQQVVGTVRLRKPGPVGAPARTDAIRSNWSTSEVELVQALGDQLSVALESARLFEETRRRAERERLTSEITTKVRASDDPQVILQTAVSELRRVLQASRAQALVVSPAQLAQPEEQDSGRHSPSALDKSSTEPTSEHSQSPQPPSGASANG